jgi:2-polyprenyl-3-methyl-5-hydroxy-6-metoxy-1,4-benzoquinol methylase
MDLKEEKLLGSEISNHWYYRSKLEAIKKYISHTNNQVILDVGAGSGYFSKELLASTSAKESWCIDISYPLELEENIGQKKIYYRKKIEESNANLILMMDVLEHIDNDLEFLKKYKDICKNGSKFIITVPAFNFLWSTHDEFLEHKRRYTIKTLSELVLKSGLTISNINYYYGILFPLVILMRLFINNISTKKNIKSDLRSHSKLLN